jgi:hypothetical protein
MAKILVDVITPGNGKSYEFQLDDGILVSTAKARMIDEILQLEQKGMAFNAPVLLCNLDTGDTLLDNEPLSVANVKSGHRLLLV